MSGLVTSNCGAIQSARASGLVDKLTVGLYRVPG